MAERGEDFEALADRFARDLEVLADKGIPLSLVLAGQPVADALDEMDQGDPDNPATG